MKGLEAFHNTAKERSITSEARNPVRMRLKDWEGAGPCPAEWTRLKSVKYGGGDGSGRQGGRETSREVITVIQMRDDKDILPGRVEAKT